MKIRSVKENIKIKGGLRKLKSAARHEIYLVLDNIRSMFNVGAMFRTADGVRVTKIFLCGITATPPREQILKTSLGAVDWVDWEYCESTKLKVESLKKDGVQIVALEQTDTSIDYKSAKYDFPVALVVGHELKGVSKNVLEIADLSVEIPMFGRANSLNVATSCAVVLYEMVRRIE